MDIVIAGSGASAEFMHGPALRNTEGCNIVAICDPEIAHTEEVAKKLGIPRVFATVREALEHEHADALDVCSIPSRHVEDVLVGLEFGCHVLVEKPVAFNTDDLERMKKASERAGKVLSFVHSQKFLRGPMEAFRKIENEEIGVVCNTYTRKLFPASGHRMFKHADHWCHKLPGGCWYDALPHLIYLQYALVGEMKLRSVSVRKQGIGYDWIIVDEAVVVLEHSNGFAEFQLSANGEVKEESAVVTGSKGMVVYDFENARAMAGMGDFLCDRQPITSASRSDSCSEPPYGHDRIIQGFVDEIQNQGTPLISWDEAYHVVKISHEIAEAFSSQTRGHIS